MWQCRKITTGLFQSVGPCPKNVYFSVHISTSFSLLAWTVEQCQGRKLNHVHLSCISKLLKGSMAGRYSQHPQPACEVWDQTEWPCDQTALHNTVKTKQQQLKHAWQAPKKLLKYTPKASLKDFEIDLKRWGIPSAGLTCGRCRPLWKQQNRSYYVEETAAHICQEGL